MDETTLKTALKNMQHLRNQRERKISKADRLEERLDSVGVSGIYNGSGTHTNNRCAPQELLEDIIDLRRSAINDLDLLYDAQLVLEPEVEKLKNYDLRVIIEHRYFYGWSMQEVRRMFSESEPDYADKVLNAFLQEIIDNPIG